MSLTLRCMVCVLLGSVAVARIASAQGSQRVFLGAAAGFGYTIGDTTLSGSVVVNLRLGSGLRFSRQFWLEGTAEVVQGIGQSDQACVGGSPCPGPFNLTGALLGIGFGGGPTPFPSRYRFFVGAGPYRVRAAVWANREDMSVTAAAIAGGAALALKRWRSAEMTAGLRGLVLPGVHGAPIWYGGFELGLRLR